MNQREEIIHHLPASIRDKEGRSTIAAIGLPQRNGLIAMYDQFEPLGAAFGLPPYRAERRREWIDAALQRRINLAAFLPDNAIIAHCFLADDHANRAELAIFVHQNFRRKGVGTRLVNAGLRVAAAAGIQSVWGITPAVNRTAIRLLKTCGFRVMGSFAIQVEMLIRLNE